MTNPAVIQTHTTENTGKVYTDPETAQIIIDYIADLKRKIVLAEEQLVILRVKAT
jgi:hypothetical protein